MQITVEPEQIFKALAFPNRVNILRLATGKTFTSTEISNKLGVSLQSVGTALRALRSVGLVDASTTQRGVEASVTTSELGKKLLDAVKG